MPLVQDLQERLKMANKIKDIINLSEIQTALKSAVKNLSSIKETEEYKNYQYYINKPDKIRFVKDSPFSLEFIKPID